MKYALNLASDNRILSACVALPRGTYNGMPIVETLPVEEVTDFFYVNGSYVYDPIPRPKPLDPEGPGSPEDSSVWDQLDAAYQEGVDSV